MCSLTIYLRNWNKQIDYLALKLKFRSIREPPGQRVLPRTKFAKHAPYRRARSVMLSCCCWLTWRSLSSALVSYWLSYWALWSVSAYLGCHQIHFTASAITLSQCIFILMAGFTSLHGHSSFSYLQEPTIWTDYLSIFYHYLLWRFLNFAGNSGRTSFKTLANALEDETPRDVLNRGILVWIIRNFLHWVTWPPNVLKSEQSYGNHLLEH